MSKDLIRAGYQTLYKSGFTLPAGVQLRTSAYEASSTGRRLSAWGTSSAGPNASISGAMVSTRARARHVVRNNPNAASAVENYASNLVGTGIKPRWKLGNEALKEQIHELWDDWTDEADSYGHTDFYGLQELIARTEFQSGEALVRFRPRRASDGLSVPLQLQVLEPDHLDGSTLPAFARHEVIDGIEFNALGQRVFYHLSRRHPGDNLQLGGFGVSRVPAADVIHVYRMLRPGQVRGMTHLSSILVRLHELDQYEDAELVRKKTAAMFAAFITRRAGEDLSGVSIGLDEGEDASGQQITGLEPGVLQYLDEGEDIRFSEPADVGGNFNVWIKHQLHAIAAGMGLTYEQLTGDLEGVNYSSIRAGLLEFRRRIEMLQWNMMVFQLCRRVAIRWLDTAVLSGAIDIPDYAANRRQYTRIDWQPPGWDWVDPVKDQLGAQMEVRNGFASREQIVAKRGYDVEQVDKQIRADNDRADQLGLVFDSDPRKTQKSGAIQKAEANAIHE